MIFSQALPVSNVYNLLSENLSMNKLSTKFLLLFFSFIIIEGHAQSSFGLKGGFNFSRSNHTQIGSTSIQKDIDFLIGNNYGLVFKHVEKGIAGIQLELNYSQKGYKERVKEGSAGRMLVTENIELPFMTHIMIGKENTKFIINLGPYLGFLFNATENFAAKGEKPEVDSEDALPGYFEAEFKSLGGQENTNRYEFGILFGLGLVQYTPIGAFQVETRFSHALTDIYKFNNQDGLKGFQYQVLNLSLAYLIDSRAFRAKSKR